MESANSENFVIHRQGLTFNGKKAGSLTLEETLARSIDIISDQVQMKTAAIMLEKLSNSSDQKAHFLKLLNTLQILKAHLELTSKLLGTTSAEEVASVKASLKLKGKEYEQIVTKEDLNTVMIKDALEYLNERLLKNLEDIIKRWTSGETKEPQTIEIDCAWLEIITHRLKAFAQSYPSIVNFDQQDIFSKPSTDQIWRNLQNNVTLKNLGTKVDIQQSVEMQMNMLTAIFAAIQQEAAKKDNPDFSSPIAIIKEAIFLKNNMAKTEAFAKLYLSNPDEHVIKAWNIADDPWISKLSGLGHPHIGYDKCIYVPRLFPKITKDLIQKEYEEGTLNKIESKSFITLETPILEDSRPELIQKLFTQSKDKVGVRILSPEPLAIENNAAEKIGGFFHKTLNFVTNAEKRGIAAKIDPRAIVIHIHGGGFTAGSSSSHRSYLIPFTNRLNFVHFSIDYSLAPEHKYPQALDDVWQAYLWIIGYADLILGIKHEKVILMGDSSGANLVMALIFRLIKAGLPLPSGCFLIYPSLMTSSSLASPSLIRSLDDPTIPYELRKMNNRLYVPENFKPLEDPFISPLIASDELLKKMPPVRVIFGTNDPVHDDIWRLINRLTNLKRDVKGVAYQDFMHGFIAMNNIVGFNQILTDSTLMIKELVN